jgi:hypothetical protein
MNPINLIMSFIMAKSRAAFYNIPESQELTNTALLAGMVAENPMLSYIIIDNKAKNDSNNKKNTAVSGTPALTEGAATQSKENEGKDSIKNETAVQAVKQETLNIITIEQLKSEIRSGNDILKESLSAQLGNIKTEIDTVNEINKEVKESVAEIRKIFTEIVKEAQNPTPNLPAQKVETAPKKSTKPDPK